jgi:hypothetical protein
MTKKTVPNPDQREKASTRNDECTGITIAELLDAIADQGYSDDQRKAWLKQKLTQITTNQSKSPSPQQAKLIEDLKAVIGELQSQPLSDDLL